MSLFAAASARHWDFPRNTASVMLLADYAAENGMDVAELIAGTGLRPADLGDPARTINARQELGVATNLVNKLGSNPQLGLDAGARYRVATFGIFGYACLTSPTLGEATRFAMRYYELSFAFCLPQVLVEGHTATLRFELPDISGPVARFLVQRDVAAIATVIADLLGRPVPFDEVTFTFPAEGAEGVHPALGVAATYEQPENTASFDAAMLDRRLPQANPITVAMCESQCRALVNRHRVRIGVASQVRERLVSLDGQPRTITTVAQSLAMSERTLRRRLTEEHVTFRELLDEVHYALAQEMLATGALSVDDVAVRLGYAEASSFITAFKRWSGTTPARFSRGRG
ncbi:AraC family transcriptional regulator [Skermania sp. ID1734]|uniref:AraC family transcriptional regulator n=1 Tax=Skermania sp. ID1734 TaxID=2597516 RepID=UPI00117FE7CD|nr:AraC family transcriptional regulator [Skermania sp. ID1734]TSD94604.1 AraC family transcriptional regulator [Skermania sp. ID1734]